MISVQFDTHKTTTSQYRIVDDWGSMFLQWYAERRDKNRWSQIAVLSDEQVWALYKKRIHAVLSDLNRPLTPLILSSGEASKEFSCLNEVVKKALHIGFHRHDLLLCVGGGVCCDLGGLFALLYMRGIDYVNFPTSLMAQIDGAIGGKVGSNFELRKNLLGGFHHPLLVLIDPSFLCTLPEVHLRSAFSEALKLAIILESEPLFNLLEKRMDALLRLEQEPVKELLEHCLRGKLQLLAGDPYESDLDRVLNLGHAVAHALERLPVMPGQRQPFHGEAVAIGLAATTRYALHTGLCSHRKASRILRILEGFGLRLTLEAVWMKELRSQICRIPEHRGGRMRLVVPVDKGGVRILDQADVEILIQSLFPVRGGNQHGSSSL